MSLQKIARAAAARAARMVNQLQPHKSVPELHAFWRSPDAANRPAEYLAGGHERSHYLGGLLLQHGSTSDSVLEIGCNAGRNLEQLRLLGFSRLAGVEINPEALELLRRRFPDLADGADLREGPAEEVLPHLGQHDIVFSMAVLEHIHNESSAVFHQMRRIARKLIVTIEDEHERGWRHFPRNYSKVFNNVTQIAEEPNPPGCPHGFVARVFRIPHP